MLILRAKIAFKCCNLHDLIHIFLDNGVITTPKRRILSFVFTALCLKKSLLIRKERQQTLVSFLGYSHFIKLIIFGSLLLLHIYRAR